MSKFEKLHNKVRYIRTQRILNKRNIRVMCTIYCNFCVLFSICSFIVKKRKKLWEDTFLMKMTTV